MVLENVYVGTPGFLSSNSDTVAIRFNGRVDTRVGTYIRTLSGTLHGGGVLNVIRAIPAFQSLLVVCSPYVANKRGLGTGVAGLYNSLRTSSRNGGEVVRVPILCNNGCNRSLGSITRVGGLARSRIVGVRSKASCLVCVLNFLPKFTCLKNLSSEVGAPELRGPEAGVRTNTIKVNNRRANVCPLSSPKN